MAEVPKPLALLVFDDGREVLIEVDASGTVVATQQTPPATVSKAPD